jgi:hypothetical protein
MLMYEKFLDKMYSYLPDAKLAQAIVDFLNSVNPELECYQLKNTDGIWIKSGKDFLINIDEYATYIEIVFADATARLLLEPNVISYLLDILSSDDIKNILHLDKNDIPNFVSKLNKEAYTAIKYNL